MEAEKFDLRHRFTKSHSAIHCLNVGQIELTKKLSKKLQEGGFDVRAILSPTVPEGHERLRICLHSFNTQDEIVNLLRLISSLLI